MSTPWMRTSPELGVSRPSNIEIVVVLPAPFPPRSALTRPSSTEKLIPRTAVMSPNRLVSARTLIAGVVMNRSPGKRVCGATIGGVVGAGKPARRL